MAYHLSIKHTFYLLIAAIIWGFAFVAQKDGMNYMGPFNFNFIRFFIGSIILLIFFYKKFRSLTKHELIAGSVLGLLLFLGSSFQQIGIISTQAGNAGFVTSLYIVFIPFVGYWFKKKTAKYIWFSIFVAIAGFALLSIDFKTFSLSTGDLLVLIGSIFWAIHVTFIEHYSKMAKSIELAVIQFFVCSILSLFFSLSLEEIKLPINFREWIPLLYAGLFSVGIAFTLQIYAQRFVPANIAGIILSSEAIFALFGGMVLLNEQLFMKQWIGVSLIFIVILFVQIYPLIKKKYYAAN